MTQLEVHSHILTGCWMVHQILIVPALQLELSTVEVRSWSVRFSHQGAYITVTPLALLLSFRTTLLLSLYTKGHMFGAFSQPNRGRIRDGG